MYRSCWVTSQVKIRNQMAQTPADTYNTRPLDLYMFYFLHVTYTVFKCDPDLYIMTVESCFLLIPLCVCVLSTTPINSSSSQGLDCVHITEKTLMAYATQPSRPCFFFFYFYYYKRNIIKRKRIQKKKKKKTVAMFSSGHDNGVFI